MRLTPGITPSNSGFDVDPLLRAADRRPTRAGTCRNP